VSKRNFIKELAKERMATLKRIKEMGRVKKMAKFP